jgi:hypoxanthine phosphoribosyltransferase
MDFKKAQAMLANAELIHSEATVQGAVAEVAAAIRERLADKYPLVLCVMTGGVVFCGQLLTKLDFPLDFDYHALRPGNAGRQDFLALGTVDLGQGALGAGCRRYS